VPQNAILLFFARKIQLLSKKRLLHSYFVWKLPGAKL